MLEKFISFKVWFHPGDLFFIFARIYIISLSFHFVFLIFISEKNLPHSLSVCCRSDYCDRSSRARKKPDVVSTFNASVILAAASKLITLAFSRDARRVPKNPNFCFLFSLLHCHNDKALDLWNTSRQFLLTLVSTF